MMSLVRASKRLSFYLRHCREPLYIDLNGGWASVDTMLQLLHLTQQQLEEIVATDAKGRYSFDAAGTRIRANQGHSIAGVELHMESPEPPEYLYHGTATRFLDAILREGLRPMNRQWVHISPDYETAVIVGRRHGQPVILQIRARAFVEDGHELFRSDNGVWQAKAVPADYFTVLDRENI